MLPEILQEWKELRTTRRVLRDFGLMLSAACGIWAGVLYWKADPHWIWPAVAGIAILTTGVLFPQILRRPFRVWMLLALVMGWVATRIVLTFAYILIFTPIGLVLRISGKDLLDERWPADKVSFWQRHDSTGKSERFEKQY